MKLSTTLLVAATLFITSLSSAQESRGGSACGFGNNNANLDEPIIMAHNYLLAIQHYCPTPMTITHLGMRGNGTNSGVQMALYADNNGVPDAALGYTSLQTVEMGDLYFPINPVDLAVGPYWIAIIFENSDTHVDGDINVTNTHYYSAMTYGFGVPTTFNTYNNMFANYNRDFNLWATAATVTEIDIASCGPFTYNGQEFTTNTIQEFIYISDGCYEQETLNIQIFPAIDNTISMEGTTLTANVVGASYQWVDCDTELEIPGATNQSFTPSVSGSYAVEITTNDCSVHSTCNSITVSNPASVNEHSPAKTLIYPNPANALLIIELAEPAIVDIHSVSGQLLYSANAAQIHHVDLTSFRQGYYLVQVNNETYKFIKQ